MFYRSREQSKRLIGTIVVLAIFCLCGPVRAGTELLMVEQRHCEWCEAWNTEIGGIYHRTEEGRRAPLRRQDLFDPMPTDIVLKGQVHFTPTFILLVDGREVGRIEGYPGEHFFWPLLAQLLNRTPKSPAADRIPTNKEQTKEGDAS